MSITLNTITNPDRLALINSNFSKIAQAINESLLWRNGNTAGETLLTRDVDFNSNQILNAYVDESGVVTKQDRDGSKKRNRFHSGFIAQEVKELADKLGVDFGGYQDHSVDGGCDVLSLGYDEFIPHIQKAVSLAWDKLDELEARINALEGKDNG